MKQKLFTLFVALVATTALWAQNNVITYAATEKLIETTDNYSSGLHTNAFNVAISSHAFSHGTGTITFAGDVTTIGDYAFYRCSGLTSITIPNSVTMIGHQAFCECDILTSITIPNSVTTIEFYAFASCRGLASITIGNSVTTIGNSAFENCVGLTKTNYTGTIADWCKISFDGPYANPICYSFNLYINDVEVKDLVIPNSVTTIGNYAFYGCSGLTSITIPNSVTMIGHQAFYNVNNVVYDGTASGSPWGAKCINGYVDGYLVYSDASKTTLCGCSSAATGEITLPNSVTTIENYAFLSCSGLTSITIPNSVTTIGSYSFAYCTGLTSVTIPNSVTTILVHAFLHVNNIIYSGVATCTYGKYWGAKCMNGYIEGFLVYSNASKTALCGCSSAATGEITLPYSVTTIGKDAFYECSGLKKTNYTGTIADWCKIKFEFKVKVFGGICSNPMFYSNNFFINDIEVKDLVIPQGVDTISALAFIKCSSLTSITIPNSVTTIGERAFKSCSRLTSVTIPNSVTTIGNYAFYGCTGLTSVIVESGNAVYDNRGNCNAIIETSTNTLILGCKNTIIPNSVTSIGHSAFYCCRGLTSVIIPNSVTTIGNYAFDDCRGLTSVIIPNSVTTIGELTFFGCTGLTSITIGNSVTTIGERAFADCTGLTSITCYAVTPPTCGYDVFKNISQNAKVYVPASSLTDYQNAGGWKDLQLFPIAAEVTPMDDENPVVTPTNQDVTITWPITDGTDTYTLTITKNGETVCVLTFNANGQLTNIAFAAPSHNGAHQAPAAILTAQGYQFTVTGLNPGTAYDYSVTATSAGGQTLAEYKGNFSTTGGTGFESVHGSQPTMHKYFHNGNLIIERNGVKYTATGQKVR